MIRFFGVGIGVVCLALIGCEDPVVVTPPPARTSSDPASGHNQVVPARTPSAEPEVSWDTERDGKFARFLKEKSAGMVRKAAVGIENHGVLKVEISKNVAPEDTLPLTRSLVAGARSDMPDKPFILSLYDPEGAPILKARYRPGQGVQYKIAHAQGEASGTASERPLYDKPTAKPAPMPGDDDPVNRGGVTKKDSAFASWAESHSKGMLRYVESDLERNGRLWFGVSREAKPEDVRPLTESLLKGARTEFPKGPLVATVFDPEGERIGKATLSTKDDVSWEK